MCKVHLQSAFHPPRFKGQTHDSTAKKWKLKEGSLTQPHHGLIKLSGWPRHCVWGQQTWFRRLHCRCWLTMLKPNSAQRSVGGFVVFAPRLYIRGENPLGEVKLPSCVAEKERIKTQLQPLDLKGVQSCTTVWYCGGGTLLAWGHYFENRKCIVFYCWYKNPSWQIVWSLLWLIS